MLPYIIGVIVGVFIGWVFTRCSKSFDYVGALRVDNSDKTENPYLFLELWKNVDFVLKRKYVVLKVNPKSYLTRE